MQKTKNNMTLLNRTIPPQYKLIDKINIAKATTNYLSNGIPIHSINAGSQDVVRIDFVFNAGNWYSNKPIIASATNSLMNEGTKKYSSYEIAEHFDFFGAYISFSVDNDFASISLLSLNKNISEILNYTEEMIKNSVFPEKELKMYLTKQKQKFNLESTKVKSLARRKLKEVIFGKNHPYSDYLEETDFDSVKLNDIKNFFLQVYGANNCQIFVAGKISDAIMRELENHFGGIDWALTNRMIEPTYKFRSDENKLIYIEKKDAVQSALRIGKPLFNKLHEDYMGMQVVNTILGGYFGSRLMTNIREDKGYTYGIGSMLVSLKYAGYFVIVSEVGIDVTKKAVDEIYIELKKLREDLVPEKELQLVKNYILGEFVRMFDGPFALLDSFKSISLYNLNYDYYDRFIDTVKNIESKEILSLSNKYLKQESFYELIVGKK
jgi:zinc protease